MSNIITQAEYLSATGVLWNANVAQYDGVTLNVIDNGGGSTITAESSPDNSTWTSLGTTTAKGRTFWVADTNYLRFRVSTFVSGKIKIEAEESTVDPRSLFGTPLLDGAIALTQVQYDALPHVDPKTVYLIVE